MTKFYYEKLCPICGNMLYWNIDSGLWHCSYCPYWGNPDKDESITTNNTKEQND